MLRWLSAIILITFNALGGSPQLLNQAPFMPSYNLPSGSRNNYLSPNNLVPQDNRNSPIENYPSKSIRSSSDNYQSDRSNNYQSDRSNNYQSDRSNNYQSDRSNNYQSDRFNSDTYQSRNDYRFGQPSQSNYQSENDHRSSRSSLDNYQSGKPSSDNYQSRNDYSSRDSRSSKSNYQSQDRYSPSDNSQSVNSSFSPRNDYYSKENDSLRSKYQSNDRYSSMNNNHESRDRYVGSDSHQSGFEKGDYSSNYSPVRNESFNNSSSMGNDYQKRDEYKPPKNVSSSNTNFGKPQSDLKGGNRNNISVNENQSVRQGQMDSGQYGNMTKVEPVYTWNGPRVVPTREYVPRILMEDPRRYLSPPDQTQEIMTPPKTRPYQEGSISDRRNSPLPDGRPNVGAASRNNSPPTKKEGGLPFLPNLWNQLSSPFKSNSGDSNRDHVDPRQPPNPSSDSSLTPNQQRYQRQGASQWSDQPDSHRGENHGPGRQRLEYDDNSRRRDDNSRWDDRGRSEDSRRRQDAAPLQQKKSSWFFGGGGREERTAADQYGRDNQRNFLEVKRSLGENRKGKEYSNSSFLYQGVL